MRQLKMYWLPGTPIEQFELPEGYSISCYKTESDKIAWADCCRYGELIDDEDFTEEPFNRAILRRVEGGLNPYEDVFFIDYKGEHVGTVTGYVHSDDGTGDMHMVGIRNDYRGKGLAKILNMICMNHLASKNCPYVHLTTDDRRKGAVKSYVRGGFNPVEYDVGMEERWQALIDELGIDSVTMLNEADCSVYKVLHRNK